MLRTLPNRGLSKTQAKHKNSKNSKKNHIKCRKFRSQFSTSTTSHSHNSPQNPSQSSLNSNNNNPDPENGKPKSVEAFSYDKSINPTPLLFEYLDKHGRHVDPSIKAIRKDSIISRQNIIRMLLEPTTCSLLEWQIKALQSQRVLEVGTFTGVTSMTAAISTREIYKKSHGEHSGENFNWLDGLENEGTNFLSQKGVKTAQQRLKGYKHGDNLDEGGNGKSGKALLKEGTLSLSSEEKKMLTTQDMLLSDYIPALEMISKHHKSFGGEDNRNEIKNNKTHAPPLVITLDMNTANIDEVSYKHWDGAGLIGSPLVFLPGSAVEIMTKMATKKKETNINNENKNNFEDNVYGDIFCDSFDVIFVDADKNNYQNYFELGLTLLKQNGVMFVDNVLWKGEVLDHFIADGSASYENNKGENSDQNTTKKNTPSNADPPANKKNIGLELHNFNKMVHQDPRVDVILLPLGDGLTMIRKL